MVVPLKRVRLVTVDRHPTVDLDPKLGEQKPLSEIEPTTERIFSS